MKNSKMAVVLHRYILRSKMYILPHTTSNSGSISSATVGTAAAGALLQQQQQSVHGQHS
jgi:hypothetical protein